MKGGKNKSSGVPSGTDTAEPPSDTVSGDNGVSSEQLSDQERDGGAEVAGEQQRDAREEEKDEEELADAEKPKLAEGFYEIEAVRRKRIRKGIVQYLIKWRDWPETANTWEPVENLMTCYDVIEAFEEILRSGKQQSTRKLKPKPGVTHTQVKRKKKKQDQHSPADATYNVSAVKVRIVEEPVPSSPPLASLNVIDHVDSNGSGLNNNKVANGNDLELDSSVKEIEEQNELHLKISELKGAMATKEVFVYRSGNDFTSGFSIANGTESLQSGRSTGAKRRKSASVRRFKPETTKGVANDPQDAVANATSGPLVAFMQEGIHDHGFVGNAFGCNKKCDNSKDEYAITEIIKPMSYSASISSNDLQDVCVTFLAKRSDGKEVMVDNKFLKMNNPLVLISFYEKHLRYDPTQ